MIISSNTSGIDALRKRIEKAHNAVQPLLEKAAKESGETVSTMLSGKAPHGNSGGLPPPGDGPGPLARSFHVIEKHQSDVAAIEVQTTQPLKLRYVTKGTGVHVGKGRIYPTTKRALYWKGAAHPVRSVAGQRANNFVSPVLARTEGAIRTEMIAVVRKLNGILGGA